MARSPSTPDPLPRHVVNFAGQSIAIDYQSATNGEIVDFLFRDLPQAEAGEPLAVFQLTRDTDDGQLVLHLAERRLWAGESKENLAMVLMSEVIHRLTLENATGMALHAAALSRNGRGLLLPGQSGSGKSSLSAWFAGNGFNYLSDELSFIAAGSLAIEAFTRPINIKRRGIEPLCDALDVDADDGWQNQFCLLLPPRCLKPDNQRESAVLELLLFPRFQQAAPLTLTKLTKAQAGLYLMECLVNARNLDGHGFGETARIARSVPAYSLSYGHFDQLRSNEIRTVLDRIDTE